MTKDLFYRQNLLRSIYQQFRYLILDRGITAAADFWILSIMFFAETEITTVGHLKIWAMFFTYCHQEDAKA